MHVASLLYVFEYVESDVRGGGRLDRIVGTCKDEADLVEIPRVGLSG